MLRPPAPAPTREAAIAAEIELIEAELRRVDAKIPAVGWNSAPPRSPCAESWGDIALGIPHDDQADGDEIARTVLGGKRAALLQRLGELRSRLAAPAGAGGRRGRWG